METPKKTNRIILKLFIQFLKDNNALDLYLNNIQKSQVKTTSVVFKKNAYLSKNFIHYTIFLIRNGFTWSKTKEGYNFWFNINLNWIKIVSELQKTYYNRLDVLSIK